MIFKKKKDKNSKIDCPSCDSKIEYNHNFCPYCGSDLIDREQESKNYGLLGKDDYAQPELGEPLESMGITDKLIGSIVNSLVKNLDKQFKDMEKDLQEDMRKAEIKSFPNGIKIKFGMPQQNQKKTKKAQTKKAVTQEQIQKMSSLPRAAAKSSIKRLNDTLIYELKTPGVSSPQDIFISKLEEGYEIKAIGEKKVYINNLPVNLPLKRLSLQNSKLFVEFKTEENF